MDNKLSWVYQDNGVSGDSYISIYVASIYMIVQTRTTVGWGDLTGQTGAEYVYCMCLMFIGLVFFSFLMGSINKMLSKSD